MKVFDINSYIKNIDLFIFSSGFEKRSSKLGDSLNPSLVKKAFAFHLDETYHISSIHLETVKKNLTNTETIIYPKNQSLATFEIFARVIKSFVEAHYIEKKLSIVIDVTAFTREVMLILINVLCNEYFINKIDVTLVHTPAKSYSDSKENLWLTKGVREIRSIIGYSGLHSPSKELLLIILNGFEEERAERIIETFEPYKLIIGKPSRTDSINESLSIISTSKFNHLRSKFENIILEEFEFSCQNIIETKKVIGSLCKQYSDEYNISISPLNNKISTIAVGIVAIENQEIQISYSSANQYNIDAPHEACDYFLCYMLYPMVSF